jgi:hypothetical protein
MLVSIHWFNIFDMGDRHLKVNGRSRAPHLPLPDRERQQTASG